MATTEQKKRRGGPGSPVSPAALVRSNNRWRESYNPLRGLVMTRVVGMLEAGERGELADLQWLYRMIERRYPVLRSLVMRRRAAISKLEWTIRLKDGLQIDAEAKRRATPEEARRIDLAERQREVLKGAYGKIRNLNRAIRHMALAEFRGYTILQKHRDDAGDVVELHWLPQWNWVRDGGYGDWYWNPEARSTGCAGLPIENRIAKGTEGTEGGLERREFVIREVEMPIDEIAVSPYLRTGLGQKDWDAFIELFGLPGCVVIMPPNIPADREEDFKDAATSVAEGSSGALPAGADAKFPSSSVRGSAPFREYLEWQEKDVVLAGTGGKLTMLTGPTGLGGGQAEVHEDVFDEIATAEAGEISEVLHEDFDLPLLDEQFPGEPVLAEFWLQPVDKTAEQTRAFKREVFKAFMADGTVVDILANQTDLKQLTQDVDLPVNREYVDPYVPVTDAAGAAVTGEVMVDKEGDIIGARPGQVESGQRGVQSGEGGGKRAEGQVQRAEGGGRSGTNTDGDGLTRTDTDQQEPIVESTVLEGAARDVQATALNGAQVAALADLAKQVAEGQLPMDTARAMAAAAFPLVSPELLERIFAPLENFRPASTGDVAAVVNRAGDDPQAAVGRAVAADLAPVRERLERILGIEDPEILRARLQAFGVELEGMKADLEADPELARELEKVLSAGLVSGLREGAQKKA